MPDFSRASFESILFEKLAVFAVVSPFYIDGTPRISAAERRQNQVVPFAESRFVFIQAKRNRRCGRVTVAVDIDHTFLASQSHTFGRRVDDTQVGLMGYQIDGGVASSPPIRWPCSIRLP